MRTVRFFSNGHWVDSGACLQGLNILGHAQLIEFNLGSQCGGHGKCGADRIVLTNENAKQVNPPTAIEKAHLTAQELLDGVRLACQTFPNSDDLDLQVVVKLGTY